MPQNKPKEFSRRDFIRDGVAGVGASAFSLSSLGSLLSLKEAHALPRSNSNYQALVLVFLAGGNDSYNMLIPTAGPLRERYEQGRGIISIAKEELHPISLTEPANIFDGTTHSEFGFHPSCPQIAELFNNNELNVMCNAGNLVTPVSLQAFQSESVALPPQLFSHADQQRQIQSEPSGLFNFGWGGRTAELLAHLNTDTEVSPLISMSGLNAFQVSRDGLMTAYELSSNGLISLDSFNGLRASMINESMASAAGSDNLLGQKYASVYQSAQRAEAVVRASFEDAELKGIDYDAIFAAAGGTESLTQERLKTVAKMIAGRASTTNTRPVFFVEMDGFDTHRNLLGGHAALMADLDASLKGFRDALIAQGDFDSVVTMVGSEFGRTFTPNGNDAVAGTDHGWGGHYMFMGGVIDGGKLHGTHPDFRLEQGLDTGRGRWIPTTSSSQCSAELARWMGVSDSELLNIFPSLANFGGPPSPTIIA
jgi:uncharacterized protein (DUF1501 family)